MPSRDLERSAHSGLDQRLLLGVVAVVLLVLPLAVSHDVHRGYSLPRYLLALLAATLAALLLVRPLLARRPPEMGTGRWTFAALLLLEVAALAVSAGFRSRDLHLALFGSFEVLMGLASYVAAAVLGLAARAATTGSTSRLHWLLRALAALGVLTVIMGPCRQDRDAWRWTGAFGHSNYSSHALLIPLFAALGLSLAARRKGEALLWAAGALAMAVELVLLQTRGAWIAAMAGGVLFAVLMALRPLRPEGASRTRGIVAIALGGSALLVVLSASLLVPTWRGAILEKVQGALRLSAGSSSRLEAWRSSPAFLGEHLFLGTGPEGFRNAFLPFKSEELGRSLGREQLRDLHSLPLQALAESGLAGLLAFAGLVVLAVTSLARLLRSRSVDPREKHLAAGLLTGLAAHLIHGLTICHVVSTAVIWHIALGAAAGAGSSPQLAGDASSASRNLRPSLHRALTAACAAVLMVSLLAAVGWYGARLWRADHAILLALSHGSLLERGGGEPALEGTIREGRRAVDLAPEVGEYHYLLASTLARGIESGALDRSPRRQEALDLAFTHAQEALRVDEKKENATLELARLHWLAGRLDLAEKEARASIAIDRCFFQSHRILALLLLAQGRLEEARKEVEAVERLRSGPEVERLRKLLEDAGAARSSPAAPVRGR